MRPGTKLLLRVQQQCAAFSSKHRVRYGSETETRKSSKLQAFVRDKQRAQLHQLKQALAKEEISKLELPIARAADSAAVHTPTYLDSVQGTGAGREFARMQRIKAAKQKRVKHLPLFRVDSPLVHHFGEQTLGDYDVLPVIAFDGDIAVIHSAEEEAQHEAYLRAQKVLGVDTESKPDFHVKKQSNPVCLIQIATLDRAFIYRLQRGQPLPPVLRDLFADADVLKIGHSLHDDFRQLKSAQLVQAVNSTVDTLPIANKLGCLRPGLKTLCPLFLGGNISKDMQVSNWEAPTLSSEQILYAATDAWAPLRGMTSGQCSMPSSLCVVS